LPITASLTNKRRISKIRVEILRLEPKRKLQEQNGSKKSWQPAPLNSDNAPGSFSTDTRRFNINEPR
jgi:hypothetical protein